MCSHVRLYVCVYECAFERVFECIHVKEIVCGDMCVWRGGGGWFWVCEGIV